jgi:hypothetical protein
MNLQLLIDFVLELSNPEGAWHLDNDFQAKQGFRTQCRAPTPDQHKLSENQNSYHSKFIPRISNAKNPVL